MSSLDAIDELTTSLRKQRIGDTDNFSHLPPPTKRFVAEMKKSGFTIFKPISDLGYYEWKPDFKGHSPLDKVSVDEIKRQIRAEAKPALLKLDKTTIKLPFEFAELPPRIYENKYPLSDFEIAGLHVAITTRGLKLEDIDFVFCGASPLSMLGNKNEDGKMYRATRIPGTSVCILAKDESYEFNLAEPGYQFERLVTGKPIDEISDPLFIKHMQLMQVGEHTILFIAKVDALHGVEPVEVTCSNPYFWDIKTCLQCVSAGSSYLIHGTKYKGRIDALRGKVCSIVGKNLSLLYEEESEKLKKAEQSILQALDDLKQELADSDHPGDCEVSFSASGQLQLLPQFGASKLLPARDVVDALLRI